MKIIEFKMNRFSFRSENNIIWWENFYLFGGPYIKKIRLMRRPSKICGHLFQSLFNDNLKAELFDRFTQRLAEVKWHIMHSFQYSWILKSISFVFASCNEIFEQGKRNKKNRWKKQKKWFCHKNYHWICFLREPRSAEQSWHNLLGSRNYGKKVRGFSAKTRTNKI